MNVAGKRAFDKCDVKRIEFKDLVYKKGQSGESVKSENPTEDGRTYAGSTAILHCPRTDDDLVSIEEAVYQPSREDALKGVRRLAAKLVCRGCMFSRMSPVEVAQHRTALAKAETERVTAFAELAKARGDAIEELGRTDIDFLTASRLESSPHTE